MDGAVDFPSPRLPVASAASLIASSPLVHDRLPRAQVAGQPSAYSAPLNRHHSHFVFVDNGKEESGAWGSEVDLRTTLVSSAGFTPTQFLEDTLAYVAGIGLRLQPRLA